MGFFKNVWKLFCYLKNLNQFFNEFCIMYFSGGRMHLPMKAKNVSQTEIIIELREAILLIARHFDFRGAKTVNYLLIKSV